MKTMFLAVIASATLMTSAACKKTETETTGMQQTELDKANADLADARVKYMAAAKERLTKIDARIDELGKRADAESRTTVTKLRAHRDQVAARLDTSAHQAAAGWSDFKRTVDDGVDSIEKEVDTALR
jgi:hypothetical protein